MARSSVSDEVIVESISQLGMQGTANKFGLDLRNLHYRRRNLEARLNIKITPKSAGDRYAFYPA
jgi:hypothetical protein